jgi:hypothetical protein
MEATVSSKFNVPLIARYVHAHEARQMEVIKNIEIKVKALQDAETAMLTLNSQF